MCKTVILLGIDGLGRSFENRPEASNLKDFFSNGSLLNVTANTPTDSAENWGSILTGVKPNKHNLKLEDLYKPYDNHMYPSLFKIILKTDKKFKVSAYVSWEPIITGMIERFLNIDKYAPNMNENIFIKAWMFICRHWLYNSIYDYFLVQRVLKYIKKNNETNFLFIHLVDLDETGHLYGFETEKYYEKLRETDNYVSDILETTYKFWSDPLIIITTDHGGLGTSHGGNSCKEKNVFIGSNHKLETNLKSNMCCSKIVLQHLNIKIPEYFDNESQV